MTRAVRSGRIVLTLVLALLFNVLLVPAAIDPTQVNGCCCNSANPSLSLQSIATLADCQARNWLFVNIDNMILNPEDIDTVCIDTCASASALPQVSDQVCGDPGAAIPVVSMTAVPVKGERSIVVSWETSCAADSYAVERCEGTKCKVFKEIARVSATSTYQDEDPQLRTNVPYTYQVKAVYAQGANGGMSVPLNATTSVGDLECVGKLTTGTFCIGLPYYYQYKSYLQEFGYNGTPTQPKGYFADTTEDSFYNALSATFQPKLNGPFSCNAKNELVAAAARCNDYTQDCRPTAPYCVEKSTCQPEGLLLGLGITREQCEEPDGTPVSCYFDRSASIFDTCYKCGPSRACIDYKSQDTCTRNPCGLGACEWRPYDSAGGFPSGVCVDTEASNCAYCDKPGTDGAEASNVFSLAFDQCIPAKADALSTDNYPCFYSADSGGAASCAEATCGSFPDAVSCGAASDGVILDEFNTITSASTNACGFKFCSWDAFNGQCRKDAGGLDSQGFDCQGEIRDSPEELACEADIYAPRTLLATKSTAGRVTAMNYSIYDRISAADKGSLITKTSPKYSEYFTYVCVVQDGYCEFQQLQGQSLKVNDLQLLMGTEPFDTQLVDGVNTLRYFSVDPSQNRGTVATTQVLGCAACDGPEKESFNVTGGSFDGTSYYTNQNPPVFRILLNEPGQVVSVVLRRGSETFPLTYDGTNFLGEHLITASSVVPEGEYTFTFNARDINGVQMEEPINIKVIIDTTAPRVSISLKEGQIIESQIGTTSPIKVNVSERFGNHNITVEEEIPVDTIGTQFIVSDISAQFAKQGLFGLITNSFDRIDGQKTLVVKITDFAGNVGEARVTFYLDIRGPIITILSPYLGKSATMVFDLKVKTDGISTCRYFSGPLPPQLVGLDPEDRESLLEEFDATDARVHVINRYNGITVPDQPFPLFVECKDDADRYSSEVLEFWVLQSPPRIITMTATPNPIVQRPIVSRVQARLNQPAFCKYDFTEKSYEEMTGLFGGFGLRDNIVEIANVTLPTEEKTTVYVACKNALGMGPATGSKEIDVDLDQYLKITSYTALTTSNSTFPLSVVTNRDALCTYLFNGRLYTFNGVNATPTTQHTALVSINVSGRHTIGVECTTPGGISNQGIERMKANISILIDTTAPYMVFVKDDVQDTKLNNTQIQYRSDGIYAAWLGNDTETKVTRYYYQVKSYDNKTIVDCTNRSGLPPGCEYSTRKNPNQFFMINKGGNQSKLNLSDKIQYYLRVAAQNEVELLSAYNASDGVTINLGQLPSSCKNGIVDNDETDMDCGGVCTPCNANQTCQKDSDCLSSVCDAATLKCAAPTCTDLKANGQESDIDCGGSCEKCTDGKSCLVGADCTTGYCSAAGICGQPEPCRNYELDQGETDVDCGGYCPSKCSEGKACSIDADCASNTCTHNFCAPCDEDSLNCGGRPQDKDGDLVPDDLDQCPRTPKGEPVDENGCAASEKDTDKDGMPDAWEELYGLDPNDPTDGDGDLDGDGITNREEYIKGTNPLQIDTDGDGWSDYDEITQGFDPLDPDSHPSSSWGIWLFIIILVLAAAGGGGYYYYYQQQKAGASRVLRSAASGAPKPFLGSLADKMKGLVQKGPMKPGAGGAGTSLRPTSGTTNTLTGKPVVGTKTTTAVPEKKADDGWVSFDTLGATKKAAAPKEDIFAKLKAVHDPKAKTELTATTATPGKPSGTPTGAKPLTGTPSTSTASVLAKSTSTANNLKDTKTPVTSSKPISPPAENAFVKLQGLTKDVKMPVTDAKKASVDPFEKLKKSTGISKTDAGAGSKSTQATDDISAKLKELANKSKKKTPEKTQ